MSQRLRRLPSEVDALETMDGVLDLIEWLQIERDREDANRPPTPPLTPR